MSFYAFYPPTNLVTATISGPVTVNQGTSPWVVSGTVGLSEDHNYGVVGANTLRTASQIGNATGAADFGAGTTTAQTLRVVLPTDQTAIPVTQSGSWTVTALQGTTPWTVNGTVAATQSGTWNIGTITTITNPVTVNQGTSPWVVSGTVSAAQSGAWSVGRTWTLLNTTDSVNIGNFPATVAVTQSTSPWVVSGTVTANQGTSPWVVSGTITTTNSDDHNYGTVGANTLRTAAQIGNATGAASFNAGTTTAQTLRVVLPTDQTPIPVTQSGVWNINDITGDITLPTGAATEFKQDTLISLMSSTIALTGTPVPLEAILVGGRDGSGNLEPLNVTANGTLNVANAGIFAVQATQASSPWIVSGTVTTVNSDDHNYGPVGANTLRTAAQIGNATGAALFGAGTTTAQVIRVVLPTDQTAIPVTQSGTWTTGRTWTLLNTTDSVNIGNFPATQPVSGTVTVNQGTSPWVGNITQFGGNNVVTGTGASGLGIPRVTISNDSNILVTQSGAWTVTANQGTSPWVVSGTVVANAGTGNFTVVQPTGTNLHAVIDNFPATVAVTQSTSPWIVSGTVTANAGTGNFNVTQSSGANLHVNVDNFPADADALAQGSTTSGQLGALGLTATTTAAPTYVTATTNPLSTTVSGALRTDSSATTQPVSGTVTANQGTSPWVVSGTITTTNSDDHNYGTVGANTLRSAAQIGNATGAADFNFGTVGAQTLRTAAELGNAAGAALFGAGTTTAQVLRVVLPTDQTAIPVTQSGTWTVQQGTPPWSVGGNVASGATDSGNPVKIGLVYNTTDPAPTNGQRVDAQANSHGALAIQFRTTYRNLTGNATTTVKSGAGILHSVVINNNSTGGTITVYDNTAGSGTIMFTFQVGSPSGGLLSTSGTPGAFSTGPLGLEFATGLTVVTAGSTSNNVTFLYR